MFGNAHPLDIPLLLIIGAIIVAILMNPRGFATATTSIGGATSGVLSTISGSGYKLAS